MGQHHMTAEGPVPFTPEEEAEWAAAQAEWVANESVRKASEIRFERNSKLTATDWTQVSDAPTSIKNKWIAYRQALRDVPQQAGFPTNVQWPVEP